jgi:hypothetical protein
MRIKTLILAPLLFAPGLLAQEEQREVILDELPSYYEFYMKTGQQEILRQERARDQQIDAGALQPIEVNQPLPALSLPLPNGETLDFLDYKGRKNLVIVSYRSWW